jgi:hypothetical protein
MLDLAAAPILFVDPLRAETADALAAARLPRVVIAEMGARAGAVAARPHPSERGP